ncbi:unnamed protein product [Tetraodon nigroviridis]|uniref:(spotted green pufferfish) hypothetical protein n=1 Tax=Tetraodon nigroviridis TaxID=99883 RepID=Q4RSE7_TETNG|nr:unnamed protein product [Tetraodon nigroviridis]
MCSGAFRPLLQRGSSFTFLTPGTPWDFSLKRKRKEKEDDTVSLSSFDLKVSFMTAPQLALAWKTSV